MIERTTIVAVDCIQCKETQHITTKTEDLDSWQNGELIQNAMPYLSADQREVLISGVCGTCFDNMFAPQEGKGETHPLEQDPDPIGDADTDYDIEFKEGEV